MTRWSSCGLLLACMLVAARPAAAQDAAGPRTYDLTLEQALALARTRAPAVRVSQARIGEARGRLVDAEVLLRDNPTFKVGGGPRVGPGGTSPDVDIGVGQVFDLGGQRGARIDAASADIERSAATAEDTARRTLRDVAAAFLRARYAVERVRIANDTERLTAELHRVAQRRHQAGAAGVLDVNVAALTLARVQAEVRTAEAARARAVGDLRRLLGLEADAMVSVSGDLLDRQRHTLAELLARAPDRADLRALDAAARQADAEARLGEAEAWPDLGLGLGYAREGDADIALGTVTLTLPFFDHGQGIAATARARGEVARIERETTEAAVASEVRTAFEAYQRLVAAVDHFEQRGLPQIEQSDTLARRTYEAGAMQLGELLAIRRELVDARVTHANLLLGAALAGVELEAEAGVLR
jgi:cobalt-zinc-cadmium efflux system outer membrane protein